MRKRKEEREREILRKKVKLICIFFLRRINFIYYYIQIFKKNTILRFRIFLFKFICDVCFCTSDLLCVNTRTYARNLL